MDFPFVELGVVAKDPIVVDSIPDLTRLAFVAKAIFVWLRKRLQLKILLRLRYSNYVLLLHGSGVEDGVTGGILAMSWCTRFIVISHIWRVDFLCRLLSLGCSENSSVGVV